LVVPEEDSAFSRRGKSEVEIAGAEVAGAEVADIAGA
jgi:hypothetical protein